MPQILYDANLISPEEMESHSSLIYRLLAGELKYPNIKRLSGMSYFNRPAYRARINDKDRLIYTYLDDRLCILAVNNHNYDRIKRQLKSANAIHIDQLELQGEEPPLCSATPVVSRSQFLAAVPHNQSMLVWDEQQRTCHSHPRPVIFSGPPGTGKTSLLYNNMLFHLNAKAAQQPMNKTSLPLLYLSPSKNLIESTRAEYKKTGLNYAITFTTWSDYLETLYNSKKPNSKKAVSEADFKAWLATMNYKDNAREIHYELSLIIALGEERYFQLGSRQCHFSQDDKKKKHACIILKMWETYLNKINAYDPMLCVIKPEDNQAFAEVYCDETQNLPPTALLSLIRLSDQFAASLDSEQCLLSSPYIHNCLKELLYQQHQQRYSEILLTQTWRCPPEVIAVSNQLMDAKYCMDASGNRREYKGVTSTLPQGSGLASWVDKKHLAPLNELCKAASTVVIVAEITGELRDTIQRELGTNNILTPQEAIGLEFENVILYNPVSHRPCLHELAQQKNGTAELDIEQWNELNALYVSITRAQKSVYLLDEMAQNRWPRFISKLFGDLPLNQFKASKVQTGKHAEKQWLDLVQTYLTKGLIENARGIMRFHLHFDAKTIEEQIMQAMPEKTTCSPVAQVVPAEREENPKLEKITAPVSTPLKIKPRMPTRPQEKPAIPAPAVKKLQTRPAIPVTSVAPSNLKSAALVKTPNEIIQLRKKIKPTILKKFLKQDKAQDFLFNVPLDNGDCLFRVLFYNEDSRAALLFCLPKFSTLLLAGMNQKLLEQPLAEIGDSPLDFLFISLQGVQFLKRFFQQHPERVNTIDFNTYSSKAEEKENDALMNELSHFMAHFDIVDPRGASLARELAEFEVNLGVANTKKFFSPVHFSAQNGHHKVIREFAKHSTNYLEDVDNMGYTPAHYAAENDHAEVIRVLAEFNINLEAVDNMGYTPAHLAAENGHVEVINELAQRQVNFNARGNGGVTCAFFAAQNGHIDMVRELKKLGADFSLMFTISVSGLKYFASKRGGKILERINSFILQQPIPLGEDSPIALSPCDIANLIGHKSICTLLQEYTKKDKPSETSRRSSHEFFASTLQNEVKEQTLVFTGLSS